MQPELKEPWELVKIRDVEPLECLESGMKPGAVCARKEGHRVGEDGTWWDWPHIGNEDSGKKVEKQWPETAKESQKTGPQSQKARSESQLHF